VTFVLDEDRTTLRDTLRDFLAKYFTEDLVRADMSAERGMRDEAWQRLCGELRLVSLVVPEEYGGDGFGAVETAIVLQELGRVLAPVPYLTGAVVGVRTLLQLADEEHRARLLPEVADGRVAVLAAAALTTGDFAAPAGVTATAHGRDWVLRGEVAMVPDALLADVLLVVAEADGRLALFEVGQGAPGVGLEELEVLDRSRRQARLVLDAASATLLSGGRDVRDGFSRVGDAACAALAAEQLGATERLLEMSAAYAVQREQFGRQIGAFQAVKHKVAGMLLLAESARVAVYAAAAALDEPASDAAISEATSLAKAVASEALTVVAREAIQVHGGIGFTWEHPAQLFYKRAYSTRGLLGSVAMHRRRVLDHALDGLRSATVTGTTTNQITTRKDSA
jgi:alkylation response protein AidB-like acyl-CoA dehydrogenase